MTDFLMDNPDLFEWDTLSPEAIEFTEAQLQQALQACATQPANRQWSSYLQTLAQTALETWLTDRGMVDLTVEADRISANGFQVLSIPHTSIDEESVTLEHDRLTQPAHFYVLVQVSDDQGIAWVTGHLDRSHLQAHLAHLQPDRDGTYDLPRAWFDPDPSHLLLNLRCTVPAALELPQTDASPTLVESRPDPLADLNRRIINTSRWLQNQLDQVAEDLSWVLLGQQDLALSALRSAESNTTELARIIESLGRRGIQLPIDARGGYQDLPITDYPLRLYAVVGSVPGDPPEWSLLIVLGAQSDRLPAGIQLRISDPTGLLVEQTFTPESHDAYLFAQVIGTYDEAFTVSIVLPNGHEEILPNFAFEPR